MGKVKISATVRPEQLAEAKRLTGCDNVSEVLDRALTALIEDELERAHADGYTRMPQGGETLDVVDRGVWVDLPWDEEE